LLLLSHPETRFVLVFFAYALITLDNAVIFVNEKQITPQVRKHLGDHVEIRPYEEVFKHIDLLNQQRDASNNDRFLVSKFGTADMVVHHLRCLILLTLSTNNQDPAGEASKLGSCCHRSG
jgi:Xaa-Pro aminopeptidase